MKTKNKKKVVSEYNMETNKLHCCYYNNLE